MSDDFKLSLEKEIYGCMTYIGIDHNTLWNMPVYRRKFYISMHNEKIKEEQEKIKKNKLKKKK